MIISTTNELIGKTIKEYRGIVFGEVVDGISYSKDWSASIADFSGGRVRGYEEELVNSRADALNEMMERAKTIGANAILGVTIDYETISNMIAVIASGTAVVIE